jgi:hypothetical protein
VLDLASANGGRLGRWDTATRLCDDALGVARQTGQEVIEPLAAMVLAEIDAYRGDERVRTAIPELLSAAAQLGYGGATHRLHRALASFELSVGTRRQAGTGWRRPSRAWSRWTRSLPSWRARSESSRSSGSET